MRSSIRLFLALLIATTAIVVSADPSPAATSTVNISDCSPSPMQSERRSVAYGDQVEFTLDGPGTACANMYWASSEMTNGVTLNGNAVNKEALTAVASGAVISVTVPASGKGFVDVGVYRAGSFEPSAQLLVCWGYDAPTGSLSGGDGSTISWSFSNWSRTCGLASSLSAYTNGTTCPSSPGPSALGSQFAGNPGFTSSPVVIGAGTKFISSTGTLFTLASETGYTICAFLYVNGVSTLVGSEAITTSSSTPGATTSVPTTPEGDSSAGLAIPAFTG